MHAKKLITAGLPMIAVTYGLARFSYGLMLPYLIETLALTPATSGFISALSYLAYCVAIIIAMICSDRLPPRAFLILAGLAATVGLSIIAMSNHAIMLGSGLFIAGLSTGFASPPYASIVSTQIEVNLQNQTNAWINSGTSIGTAVTGAIALIMSSNWRGTYVIFTGIALLVLIVNHQLLPKQATQSKKRARLTKNEWSKSLPLISAAFLIGVSCSAYWTFSRDFLLNLANIPLFLADWFWVIIGLAGLLGGLAGSFINKYGVRAAYTLSTLILSASSLIIGLYSAQTLTWLISPFMFGSAYIFMTGVLIVWGISVCRNNVALGLGLPFLMLALGQAIGAALSGIIAGFSSFSTLFIVSAIIGCLTLIFAPRSA
ncbi:Predicted arabinose efflux permease, MFS family [Amphibacillus marinus]|uniref:Predicted arabinose efflux permease, MFS family n=1 Tax=Amphibacillus marinus TaxID=872970 RepID=A0A1H8S7N3_9BACI|nr:MFS transporter [Amphibacillus marinus]SEO75049.1 Predicted arabinose efflux permease, MFS family [Amphibacillus marinus]